MVMKIKKDIYSVGVLNPALRIFDVIMKTEYGTTYNSYVVAGDQKTALIETCHNKFFDVYVNNLKEAGVKKIDYIILNHTEPDHSGSLAKLTELYPEAKIVGTQAAKLYLANITNKELDFLVVKQGDTISLGGKTLEFIIAPFLHWPDSMLTYLKEEKVLFSCDFLGTHFCEPTMLCDNIQYKKEYDSSFLSYYTAIFSPFKEFVLAGLEKIKNIETDYVCPSHGPVLRGEYIARAKELYQKWSLPIKRDKKKVSILYASAYGCTRTVAEEILSGIRTTCDCDINMYNVNEHEMSEMTEAMSQSDALLFGSPTINKDAVAPVWALLHHIDAISAKNKRATAFGSFGWSGEAVPMMLDRLRGLKFKVEDDGFKINFVPSDEQKQDARKFGAELGASLSAM